MIKYENILKNTQPYKTIFNDKIAGRLGHCYMFLTEDEIACDVLCKLACRVVLCQNDDCGICNNCMRIENDSHSDVYEMLDYSAKGVREFVNAQYLTPSEGDIKVMLIKRLDKITPTSQNFLLKILEEPSQQTVFVLGVCSAAAVLDTIKSRSKKLFLNQIDNKLIKAELENEDFSKLAIDKAVCACYGNLTNAVEYIQDENFVENMDLMIEILTNMQTSRQVADNLIKLKYKSEEFLKYLDCLEIICKVMMDINCGVSVKGFTQLQILSKVFNHAMLVNICDLIIISRKKIQTSCKLEAVAESLFMGILEVKYKCRI